MRPEIKVGHEHRWRKTLSGAELCLGIGCTVRRSSSRLSWQPRKGGRWRAISSLPPCSAKDAPPEATSGHSCDNCEGIHPESCMFNPPEAKAGQPRHQLDVMAERLGATPPAAPSPLEVVRDFVKAKSEGLEMRDVSAALATLEESIRADERKTCIELANVARCGVNGCEHEYCRGALAVAGVIANRR